MMESSEEVKDTMTLGELEANITEMIPDLKEAGIKPAVQNPFKSNLEVKVVDVLQMILLCFLIPIRLLMLALTILLAGLTMKILLIGYRPSNPPVPMSGIRKHGNWLVWLFCRLCLFWCGVNKVTVKGKLAQESKEAPVVVVAPHSSHLDGFVLSALHRTFSAVTRIENIKAPVFGSTCTNRKALITFKPGAFYPGVPVQPVVIKYLDRLDYATWTWEGSSIFPLLCMATSRLSNNIEVEVLPVYTPSKEEKEDAFLYSRNVRDVMAKVLAIPVTDHSFEDCRLMMEAEKLGMPMEAGLVEYYKLSPMLGMNADCMIEYMQKFALIDKSRDGVVDIEEFCEYLHLPLTKEVQTIFRIYDIDKDKLISFREYLLGFFLISRPFNTEENISMAFKMFAEDEQGKFFTYDGYKRALESAMGLEERLIMEMFNEMNKHNQSGKVLYDEFKEFCLNKPEYALLYIHFRKLAQQESSMTFSPSRLRRESSVSEFQLSLLKDVLTEVAC